MNGNGWEQFALGTRLLLLGFFAAWGLVTVEVTRNTQSISAFFWTWLGGCLVGGVLIVWLMGEEAGNKRDVFGSSQFSDDRQDAERAGLKAIGDDHDA